jgi:hypothetical protein
LTWGDKLAAATRKLAADPIELAMVDKRAF